MILLQTVFGLGSPDLPTFGPETTIEDYLGGLFPWLLGAIAVLAMVMFAWGAVQYLLSVAQPGGKGEGRERMKMAIYGLLLALAAYLILKTINPDIINIGLFEGV